MNSNDSVNVVNTDEVDAWVKSLLLPADYLDNLRVQRKDPIDKNSMNGKSSSREFFVKGPVPKDWFAKACMLGNGCAEVAWGLWFLHGMNNNYKDNENKSFSLTNKLMGELGVSAIRKSNALKALEGAGLIKVQRVIGRLPIVTMIFKKVTLISK